MKEKQYRSLEQALSSSKNKKNRITLDKLAKDITEEKLNPYYKDSKKVFSDKYYRDINTLKKLIGTTPEGLKKISEVDLYLRKDAHINEPRSKTKQEIILDKTKKLDTGIPLKKSKITEYTKKIKPIAKFLGTEPESVETAMKTRSGIRNLKEDLLKTKNGKKIFDSLKKDRIKNIFDEGQINKTSTGKDLFRVINDQKTYGILEELAGKEETKQLYDLIENLNKKKSFSEGFISKNLNKLFPVLKHVIYYNILKNMIGF